MQSYSSTSRFEGAKHMPDGAKDLTGHVAHVLQIRTSIQSRLPNLGHAATPHLPVRHPHPGDLKRPPLPHR